MNKRKILINIVNKICTKKDEVLSINGWILQVVNKT